MVTGGNNYMSYRRKSACCCDGKQGPCFLGYGTVPKTDYIRRYIPGVFDGCAEGAGPIQDAFTEKSECNRNAYDNWAFCDPTKEEELVLFIERPATAWSTLCTTQTPNPCVECDPHPDCVDVGEGFTDDDPGGGQGGGGGGEQCCEECPGEFCSDTCTGNVSCREGCDIGPFSFNIVSEEMEPIVVRYRHPTGVSDSLNIVNELASPLPDRAKEELYQWSFKSANNVLPWPAGGPPPWTGNLYPLNGEGRVGSLGGDRQYQIHDHGNMDHGLPCYSKYNGTQRLSECGNGYDCICSQGYFWACYLDPEYVSNSGNVPFKFFGSTGLPSSKGVAHIIGDTWRTSDYGWIPGRDHDAGCYSCDPDECGDCENCGKTKVQLGPGELGGSYFWLQGIADAPKDHWYANFKPVIGGQYAFDPGPGPQGTSRLAETLLCVVHREKYYERYYTSIKQDDDPRAAGPDGVPEQNPGADFGDYEEYFPDTTIDNGQGNPLGHWWQGDEESAPGSSNAWINNRTPKYFLLGCAGCPIFTWEIALNDTLNSTEWRTLDYGSSLDDALDSIESNPVSIADLCLLIMNGLPTYGKLNLNDEPKGYLSPGLIAVLQEEGILPDAQNYGEEQDFKIFKKKMKRIDVDWDGDLGMCCLSGPVSTGNCLEVHPEGGCNISSCGGSPDATDTGGEITGEVCSQDSGNYPCCLDLGVYYEFDTDPVTGNREYIEVASQPTGNEGVDWAQGWGWDQDCVTIAEGLVGSIESPGECGQEETFCLDQTVREECRWFGGQWHGPAIPGADPPMCEIEGVEGYCIGTNAEKAGNLKGSCCKRCMDGNLFDCDDKPDCCDGRDLVTCRCAETTFQVDRDGDFSLIETCGGIDVGDEDGDPSEHGNGAGFYKWSPNKNCWNSNGFETCGPPGEFGAQCELRGPATDAEFPDFIIEEDQYFYGRPGGWAHMCSIPNPSENYAFPQVDRFRQSDGESCFTAAPIPQYTSCLDTSPCNGCNGNTDEYEACMKDHCCILAQCAVCGDGVGGNLCSSEGISETCRGAWFTYQQTVLEDGNEYNCKIHNNAWLLRVDPWLQFDSTKGPDAEEDDQVEIWKGLPGWIPTRHYDDDPHYQDDEISWYHRPFTITVPVACRENDFQFNDECCGAQCTRRLFAADGSEITCPKRGARQGIDEEEPEGDELPCVFNCKPSSGSGLPDPACGRVCPEDYYCCPYTGQCMPYSTNSPVDPPCYPCAQPCPEEQNCCVIPDPDGFPGYEAHCITGLCPQYDIPLQLPQENIEWQGVAIPGQTVRVIPGIVGGSAPYTVSYTFKVNDVITSVVEGDGAGAEYEITLDDVTDPGDDVNENDVAAFATVSNQVIDAETFAIDLVAGRVDPTASEIVPVITRDDGTTYTPNKVMLQYPGTTDNSTEIYRARVSLEPGDNTFTVSYAGGTDAIMIRRRAVNQVTATNASSLTALLRDAGMVGGETVDEVLVDYDESNLETILNNLVNSNVGARDTWCTLRPINDHTITWSMDASTELSIVRPKFNYLCLEGIIMGASDETGANAQWYPEVGHNAWFKDSDVIQQYDFSYTSVESGLISEDLLGPGEGRNAIVEQTTRTWLRSNDTVCHVTGSTFTGVCAAPPACRLMRDNLYLEHRHDISANCKVVLNNRVVDILPMVTFNRTDRGHVDLYQRWGNSTNMPHGYHDNIYWAGMRLEKESLTYTNEAQAVLFDRSIENTFSNLILKDLYSMETTSTANFVQFAGTMTNVLTENIQLAPASRILFRGDFTNGPLTPTNVHVKDTLTGLVSFFNTNGQVSFNSADADATSELNTENANYWPGKVTFHSTNQIDPV